MASHNRTPQSVLEAPKQTAIMLYETKGYNRQVRRKYQKPMLPTINKPYVMSVQERIRKAWLGRDNRWLGRDNDTSHKQGD